MTTYIYYEVETGDIIECIRVFPHTKFTLGKHYKITDKSASWISILNDDGVEILFTPHSLMSETAFKKIDGQYLPVDFLELLKEY